MNCCSLRTSSGRVCHITPPRIKSGFKFHSLRRPYGVISVDRIILWFGYCFQHVGRLSLSEEEYQGKRIHYISHRLIVKYSRPVTSAPWSTNGWLDLIYPSTKSCQQTALNALLPLYRFSMVSFRQLSLMVTLEWALASISVVSISLNWISDVYYDRMAIFIVIWYICGIISWLFTLSLSYIYGQRSQFLSYMFSDNVSDIF